MSQALFSLFFNFFGESFTQIRPNVPDGSSLYHHHNSPKSLSVFVSVPTSESMRGDSNPPALLATYLGNHSFSVLDNLLPKRVISSLSLAFQSLTLLSFKS